jgi:hypothetical protein
VIYVQVIVDICKHFAYLRAIVGKPAVVAAKELIFGDTQ